MMNYVSMMNESGRTLRDVSNRAFFITTKTYQKMKIAKFNFALAATFTLLMFAGCTNNKTQTQEPAQE